MNTATFLHALQGLGVCRFIICPGSRSAPLLLGLETLKGIETRVIADERSAAFHGLGWAEATRSPVALICTSGSAGLNFAPAIAEAFYRAIPLIVLSADRPANRVGQEEGQSLPQPGMYGQIVQGCWNLHGKATLVEVETILNEVAASICKGPVHINYAFDEPLYEKPLPAEEIKLREHSTNQKNCALPESIQQANKILVLAGQLPPGTVSIETMQNLEAAGIPVVGDLAANIPNALKAVAPFAQLLPGEYKPDALICIGGTHIWRKWPEFVSEAPHIKVYEVRKDDREIHRFSPLKSTQLKSEIQPFLENLSASISLKNHSFWNLWKNTEQISENTCEFHERSDLCLLQNTLTLIGEEVAIHAGNSLSIRYLDLLATRSRKNPIFSNRGVSGIDGCLSTAAGFALARPELQNLVILGDQSLAYDANGLWLEKLPENLKIIVLNNGGGQIFGMVKGPSETANFPKWFLNEADSNFEWFCNRYQIPHFTSNSMTHFFSYKGCAVLELKSDGRISRQEMSRLLDFRKKYFENDFQVRIT